MVYFFVCQSDPNVIIYMGKDKYENEDLIKYAWPDVDIWFHVEDLSSAHVYLRLPEPSKLSEISEEVIQECAQLTKANSIEGCKKASCGINITWAKNLKKTIGMETGAVTFFRPNEVKRIKIDKDKEIVKKIMKTKKEIYPNLEEELREHNDKNAQAAQAEVRAEVQKHKDAAKAEKLVSLEKKQE